VRQVKLRDRLFPTDSFAGDNRGTIGDRPGQTTVSRTNGECVWLYRFANLQYSYDNVGNILNLRNQVDLPPASSYGGPTNQVFNIR
ncbi:MAG: hypothetical protein ACJ8LN_02445, partial [Sulfurifustis sp.]